jgi:hypothetical protein
MTWRGLNSNSGHFGSFTFIFVSCGNRVCLSRDVQVAGAAWRTAMKIMARVGDLVQMTRDSCTGRVLGSWMIGRLGDTVCDLHRAYGDEEHEFLG